jgi:hypothetical protein
MPRKRAPRAGRSSGNPVLQAAILEVVDNQLRDDSPKEVRRTLDRLVGEGYSDRAARLLIGMVVLMEANDILKGMAPFDEARYETALKRLPRLS